MIIIEGVCYFFIRVSDAKPLDCSSKVASGNHDKKVAFSFFVKRRIYNARKRF